MNLPELTTWRSLPPLSFYSSLLWTHSNWWTRNSTHYRYNWWTKSLVYTFPHICLTQTYSTCSFWNRSRQIRSPISSPASSSNFKRNLLCLECKTLLGHWGHSSPQSHTLKLEHCNSLWCLLQMKFEARCLRNSESKRINNLKNKLTVLTVAVWI